MDAKLQSGGIARSELDQSVAGCFEKTAELYAGRVAVRDTDSVESTYLQLNLAANRIAHALRLRVPGSQKPIGLLVKDAQRSVSAILGVLKSAILEDCRIRVLLTDKENLRRAEALAGTRREVICVDHLDPDISTENLQLPISPDDLAAVFYTSGSTGKPRGVIQNQRNVLHRATVCTNCRLPWYPAVVLFCGALPRNANGKVDRQALPQFGEDDCSADDVAPPRDAFERTLRTVWQTILGKAQSRCSPEMPVAVLP